MFSLWLCAWMNIRWKINNILLHVVYIFYSIYVKIKRNQLAYLKIILNVLSSIIVCILVISDWQLIFVILLFYMSH